MIRIQITDGSGRCAHAPMPPDVDFVQVREPRFTTRELADVVRMMVRDRGARVLVNDRTDVALATGAAGVHLRDHSVSLRFIRPIVPAGFVISVACHDADAVFRAADEGADFALLAPIFAPLSKPIGWPPLGLEVLRSVTSRTCIPIVALGGITEENAPLCVEAGVAGVAGITLFQHR